MGEKGWNLGFVFLEFHYCAPTFAVPKIRDKNAYNSTIST